MLTALCSARLRQRLALHLPEGVSLPESVWQRRHRVILVVLWLHALAITSYGVLGGYALLHSLGEGGLVAATALVAGLGALGRGPRMAMATLGLVTSSAILVHLSGGVIELHFHFFVMLGLIALYQDWLPFL